MDHLIFENLPSSLTGQHGCSSRADDGRMRRRDAASPAVLLLCFRLAAIDWFGQLRLVQQGQSSLSFLHQLDAAVGHKQDGEGGQRETWKERREGGL